ncbi:hypothetical protein Tco_0335491 [Tanacetum coccineum]
MQLVGCSSSHALILFEFEVKIPKPEFFVHVESFSFLPVEPNCRFLESDEDIQRRTKLTVEFTNYLYKSEIEEASKLRLRCCYTFIHFFSQHLVSEQERFRESINSNTPVFEESILAPLIESSIDSSYSQRPKILRRFQRSLNRVRHVSLGGSTSTPDAPPTLAAKEVTETPPPNVEATSDSSAPVMHAVQSPPQTSPLTADDIARRDRETAALVAQLRARFSSKRSQSVQKDEEILLLKTQLVDAQAEAESSRSYAQKLSEEKMALLVKVEQERANSAHYKASCHWAVKYLEGGKNNHFAGLDEFRQRVEELLEKQEEKLLKLSIEYDEELYPHMLSAIAERRWLISHGLRLAAMRALESQEVKQSFGDVVKCALARGKAEAVEELHEKKLLTVPAAQVLGYNDNAYEELVAVMETMKLLELPHITQLERDQDYPIDVIMVGLTLARHATEGVEAQPDYFLKPDVAQLQVPIFARPRDILNPFALEKEIPLKESLEAHAIRLAKKKGVKGKAILCGVGAAHIPRSDGVPVSVATVSPKDSKLLGKLEEAGEAAYQVGSSEQRCCHSI